MEIIISTEKESEKFLRVNSCDIQYLCDKNYTAVRSNGRVDFHILYILKGNCYVERNGKTEKATMGDIVLFYPKEPQRYSFYAKDESVSCYIHFTGQQCEEILENLGFDEKRLYHIGKSSLLENIFEKMVDEYRLKKPLYEEACAAYFMEFLVVAARKIMPDNSKNDFLIDSICKLMHETYNKNYKMKYYADKSNLSLSRFAHRFKEVTGKAPLSYLNSIKIEKAKEILLNTDLPMSEVAYLTGFSDQNYFGRIFKNHTGISPYKYAKNM